jgi:dephospho-CoA kinase
MKKQSRGKKKIILGLTGSFGSGKSTVAAIFKSFGACVIDADKIAHRLISPGSKVYKKIINVFDRGILKANKDVDRRKLGGAVFGNKHLLKKLNSIMHPEIIRVIKQKMKASSEDVIVLDAPLLIEAGLDKIVDKLIVVTITREKQVKRVCKKTGLTRPDILRRIKAQIPLREKVRAADFVIDNSGTFEKTREQAKQIRRLLWRN